MIVAIISIPVYVPVGDLIMAWKNMRIIKNIKDEYSSLFRTFKKVWKYDFDGDKIREADRQELLDRILRRDLKC